MRYSDQPEDVHSPVQRGFWWSHVGWILSSRYEATRYELIRDSGGAGEFRGGLGIRREYLNLEPARFSIRSAKHVIPPNGCNGGAPGRTGDIWINPASDEAKRLPTRYADYPLQAGDLFRLDTPGGGGYGDALAREPERVLADVREGNVSAEAA